MTKALIAAILLLAFCVWFKVACIRMNRSVAAINPFAEPRGLRDLPIFLYWLIVIVPMLAISRVVRFFAN